MNKICSPNVYYDCALVVVYSLGDYIQLSDDKGQVWDGTDESPKILEQGFFEGVSVSYLENEECLLLYFTTENKKINIKSDGETLYFFAEINDEGSLTENSTDDAILYENVDVIKEDGKICIESGTMHEYFIHDMAEPEGADNDDAGDESSDGSDRDISDNPTIEDSVDSFQVEELKREISRLQKLLTEVSDSSYDKMYTQVQNMNINENTAKLYTMKLEYERQLSTYNEIKEKLDSIQSQRDELIQSEAELRRSIEAAEQLIQEKTFAVQGLDSVLSDKLKDLGIDRSALEMYASSQDVESVISEANAVEEKMRTILRRNVEIRQKVCDDAHNKVAEG